MPDLYNTDPQQLASLLDVESAAADPSNVWRPEELAAILRHQLAVPLGEELGEPILAVGRELESAGKYRGLASHTFGELLLGEPTPPLEALELIKQFAKVARARRDSLLPPEVATVLYFASILIARHRHGVRITSLPEAAIAEGGRWIVAQPWVGNDVKSLTSEILDHEAVSPAPPAE